MLKRLAVFPLLLLCASAYSQGGSWRFVVSGDGRADGKHGRPEDKDGVNVAITRELARAIVKERPKALLWTGDLCLGTGKGADAFEKMLTTWRTAMKPVYDAGVIVLACRGNHEAGSSRSAEVWRKVFAGRYAMPGNGPVAEKGLTFFKAYRNALFIGLDQYTTGTEMVNQPWLDAVLAKNRLPFIFAFGHEPAFMDGTHRDTMDTHPDARNAFWESLIKSGSRVFFAGHDHLYDHMLVQRDGTAPGPVMHQIVAGTAGAPFYTKGPYRGNNAGWKLVRAHHIDNRYGYLVVELNGDRATVTFKGRTSPGVYKAMDSFSYTVARQ